MKAPIENAGPNGVERRSAMRLYIGMHRARESTTLATLLACAEAKIATFTVDKSVVSVFMICSKAEERAEEKVSAQRTMSGAEEG
jgi:hypothetical protein